MNARTCERTTDYFFEVPVSAFAGGLERLCDMLAKPCLTLDKQRREREVLHAEFLAWARNATAQQHFALYQGLSPVHPLRGFHAGNRYSLAVPNPAFQQALHDFHARFYHAGQMTLSLVGPQTTAELKALARDCGLLLSKGSATVQTVPLPLGTAAPYCLRQGCTLSWLLPCEALPTQAGEAIEFLGTWLGDAQPGGLLAELRRRGWLETFSFRPLYRFARQALLQAEFTLSVTGVDACEQIGELFFDWLRFFRATDWHALLAEYALLQQRHEHVSGALELARHDSEHFIRAAVLPSADLRTWVDSILASHASATPVHTGWRLPAPNPFLRPVLIEPVTAPMPAALTLSPALAHMHGINALYLRWHVDSPLRESLGHVLTQALQSLCQRARQGGVELSFSTCSNLWQLRCFGAHEAVVAVLEQALIVLTTPPPEYCSTCTQPKAAQPLQPIRQLLEQLPHHVLGAGQPRLEQPDPATVMADLQHLWAGARWQGLATGFCADNLARLRAVLQAIPGQPSTLEPHTLPANRSWHCLEPAAKERGLLLFCPAPDHGLATQATWRLLAHVCQGPFYRRLRVELQLGYAVFSTLQQLHGITGLVFGVQSPMATCEEILRHISTFLDALPRYLADLPHETLASERQALAAQFNERSMANADIAEWAWQSLLAGHSSADLQGLQQSILRVDTPALQMAANQLAQAQHGWVVLATSDSVERPPVPVD
ncbi:Protease 3 precursor [compost metagenome]